MLKYYNVKFKYGTCLLVKLIVALLAKYSSRIEIVSRILNRSCIDMIFAPTPRYVGINS